MKQESSSTEKEIKNTDNKKAKTESSFASGAPEKKSKSSSAKSKKNSSGEKNGTTTASKKKTSKSTKAKKSKTAKGAKAALAESEKNKSKSNKASVKSESTMPVTEKANGIAENVDTSKTPKQAENHVPTDKQTDSAIHLKESTGIFEIQKLDPLIFADTEERNTDNASDSFDNPTSDSGFIAEWQPNSDEYWDDEFSDIPDNYSDDEEDTTVGAEDESGSIVSLLYVDEDSEYESDYSPTEAVSFAQLRLDMQRLKEEAKELRNEETEAESSEQNDEITGQFGISDQDATEESNENPICDVEEFHAEEPCESDETDISDPEDEEYLETDKVSGTGDGTNEYTPEIQEIKEEKSGTIAASDDGSTDVSVREHIITIDRTRIKNKEEKSDRAIDVAFETVSIFVFTLMAILLVTGFLFRHTVVAGSSMEGTLSSGDYLVISDLFYTPRHGDIVVCDEIEISEHEKYGITSPVVKRIIALEGDTVKISNGVIYLNGEILDESAYITKLYDQSMDEITVPEGKIFVMGDNRANSCDSEEFGCVDADAIIGRVVLRFYPVKRIKIFN